jgi:hypothetical protein
METVARVAAADLAHPRDLERGGRPVLVDGATDGWDAPHRWTVEHLRRTVGDRRVPVEFYPSGSYYGPWTEGSLRLDRYLSLLQAPGEPERCYLAQVPLVDLLPELAGDVRVPRFLEAAPRLGLAFFLGRDTVTALHFHSREQALLCQVAGEKRVTLFPPTDVPALRYEPWYSYRFNFSRIDFSAGDAAVPPEARPVRCTVRAGEALFIPLYWGHLVEGPGLTTSVTFFWSPTTTRWSSPRLRLRAVAGGLARERVIGPLMAGLERRVGR